MSHDEDTPDHVPEKKHGLETLEIKIPNVEEVERIKLRTDKLDVKSRYTDMLESFLVDYKHEIRDLGKKPHIVVLGGGKRAEANLVFGEHFKEADITSYVASSRQAVHLTRFGMPSEKHDMTARLPEEPADILVAFYDSEATSKGGRYDFERQVAYGGIILCKQKMAQELLEDSDFKFMGTLKAKGGLEHSERAQRTDYWEAAVKNDNEFKDASAKLKDSSSVMKYEEAVEALRKAGMPTGEAPDLKEAAHKPMRRKSSSVIENYKELYDLARNDSTSRVDDDGTIHYRHEGMKESVVLKKPPFSTVDDNLIFVVQKRRPGTAR